MKLARRVARVFLGVTIVACTAAVATAQQKAPGAPPGCQNLRTLTTAEDHQNMLAQLGIKALRPGPSGNEAAPNHANTDEALANPFPDYPDPLVLKSGRKVATADAWWKQRRPEIVEDFEREVLGRVPAAVPKVTWTVAGRVPLLVGSQPALGTQLVGRVENAGCPAITVEIQAALVTPAGATAVSYTHLTLPTILLV